MQVRSFYLEKRRELRVKKAYTVTVRGDSSVVMKERTSHM